MPYEKTGTVVGYGATSSEVLFCCYGVRHCRDKESSTDDGYCCTRSPVLTTDTVVSGDEAGQYGDSNGCHGRCRGARHSDPCMPANLKPRARQFESFVLPLLTP
eukprot:1824444-Rhodomonas_salina.1